MADKDDDFEMSKLYPPSVEDQIAEEELKKQAEKEAEEADTETETVTNTNPPELTFDPPVTDTDKELRRLDIEAEMTQRELEEAERALKYTLESNEIGQKERESDNLKDQFNQER